MERNAWALMTILVFISAISCKTSQPSRPMERYDEIKLIDEMSMVRIPVRMLKGELERDINQRLQGVIYEDTNLRDDDLALRATKVRDIEISIEGQTLFYKVPLDIWVKKGLKIASLEASGAIALEFKTSFHINPDWELVTATELKGFQWQQKPVLKMGFADLPIQFIANTILNRSKGTITQAIDKEIGSAINLRERVETTWKQIQQPMLVSQEFKSWVLLNPQRLMLSPFRMHSDTIESHIQIEAAPAVVLGDQPAAPLAKPLPGFTYSDFGTGDFNVNISTMLTFGELERIARTNLVGDTFSSGKNKVTVQDIKLYGQGNNLVVDARVAGSFKGDVYLIGQPVYDPQRNTVDIHDLDFEVSTKNVLHKSASWLFRGALKNKIRENMNFLLEYNLENIKKTIQAELDNFELTPGVRLIGHLEDIGLQRTFVTPEGVRVFAKLEGHMTVEVKGL
jgi:hypothetical protein